MFKILSRKRYRQLIDERNDLRRQVLDDQEYNQLENKYRNLEKQKNELEKRLEQETTKLQGQLEVLQQESQESELIQQKYQKLKEEVDLRISEEIDEAIQEFGLTLSEIEKLWTDRSDLIELYVEKMYSLAKHFAKANEEMRKNRGLFLLLVDRRNMVDDNFSEFHDAQMEHLAEHQYEGIDQLPHIFSLKVKEVFNYMGEKIILKDDTGKITGHEERDGALLIDLKGTAFRSCMMVEGVRTHRVYSKVERLQKGSARHNAAIYASSLDEVMAAIVISEQNSEVTMFRDGCQIKSYDPYTDVETSPEQKVIGSCPEVVLVCYTSGHGLPDS